MNRLFVQTHNVEQALWLIVTSFTHVLSHQQEIGGSFQNGNN